MNYMLFRVLILIIFVLAIIFIFKFLIEPKKCKIFLIIIFLIFIFICYYPIENKLFKFSSIDKAFSYYYPSVKIKEKFVYDDYAYIVYDDKRYDSFGLMHLTKKNGNWEINNLLTKGSGKYQMNSDCFIYVIRLRKMDSSAIFMTYGADYKGGYVNVADSMNSNFITYNQENVVSKLVIFNSKIDDNYTIYFNENEYQPFKRKFFR